MIINYEILYRKAFYINLITLSLPMVKPTIKVKKSTLILSVLAYLPIVSSLVSDK